MQGVAGVPYSIAELLVPARDEPVVEVSHVVEQLARDEQARRRCEAVLLDERRDRESREVVVAPGERRLGRRDEAHIGREVVCVALVELVEGGLQPVLGDRLVGVEEDEHVARSVLDAGVSGRVGGLDIAFVAERDVVVVGSIFAGDLRRVVCGTVVDDEDLGIGGGVREEGVKSVAKARGIVVDGDYDGYRLFWNHMISRIYNGLEYSYNLIYPNTSQA